MLHGPLPSFLFCCMIGHPKTLAQYPWVVVRIDCKLCTRVGRYRLARLAARYGPEMNLDRLLAHLASDCPYWRSDPRRYEARCGARFVDLGHDLPPPDAPVARQRQPAREDLTRPAPAGMTMLSDWAAPMVVLACDVCGRKDAFDVRGVRAATPGGDARLTDLLDGFAASCPRRRIAATRDRCGARLATG